MHATLEPETAERHASPHAQSVLILRTRLARRRRFGWIAAGATAVVAVAVMLAALLAWNVRRLPSFTADNRGAGAVGRMVMPTGGADLSIILDTDVMPMTPEDARALNEQRPLDVEEVAPADPFRIASGPEAEMQIGTALKCLTQTIYYEAASEPEAGQRAVAQVVLNRVKHPAFPNTICGVVYQGSQRVTGCQFTFTCDGSLARMPLPALYRRAERLAREAMSGRVAPEVGNSTNYHADYVVPYWASSLNKLTQIGRHIFYGLRGAIGDRRAFRMRYDVAMEIDPAALPLEVPTEQAIAVPDPLAALPGALPTVREAGLSADVRSGSLIDGGATPAIESLPPSPLRADQNRGELIVPGARLRGGESEEVPAAAKPR